MTAIWVLIAIIVVGMGYVRLAPSDPARWHREPNVTHDVDFERGVKRRLPAGQTGLGQLDGIIQDTPRTTVLAGSVEEGMITYVTRSKVMGFPDYTTVAQDGDLLLIYARSRFGRSDLRVNRNRVDGWLGQLARIQPGS